MLRFLLALIGYWSFTAFAITCDCEVRVYAPLTGSYALPVNTIANYSLDEFGSYSQKNQMGCRQQCLSEFEEEMPTERMNGYLLSYSQRLIEGKQLGFNCTGLTTLKYPVRVKASLGFLGLGNVVDQVYVINHEQICF